MPESDIDRSAPTGAGGAAGASDDELESYTGDDGAYSVSHENTNEGQRSAVSNEQVVKSPQRWTARLRFEKPGTSGTSACSGILVGEDLVITSGHCVYNRSDNKSRRGYMGKDTYRVYIAPPRGNATATGKYGVCRAKNLYTTSSWVSQGEKEHDLGAVKLTSCTYLAPDDDPAMRGSGKITANLNGYPGDAEKRGAPYPTQFFGHGQIELERKGSFRHKVNASGGDSGAGLRARDGQYLRASQRGKAVAVHSGDRWGAFGSNRREVAKALLQSDIDLIKRWRAYDR
jgi:V8-like Glu-specific endopeptidase